MNLNFDTIYQNLPDIFKNGVIDLEEVDFFDPWAIGVVWLKAIENKDSHNKNLIPPKNPNTGRHLKRICLDKIIQELTYSSFSGQFDDVNLNEQDDSNIHEILYCRFRDQFNARLESGIRMMFKDFGMNENDEQKVTALVGELGNNVFDHNEGVWPTDVRGAIIVAQNYPKIKKIEVLVADPGVGFFGSLKGIKPAPDTDIDAIKLGLRGISGRIGERRGNGLRLIQDWAINQFNGIIRIHSGNGLIVIDKNGQKEISVNKVLGTLAEFVVSYK